MGQSKEQLAAIDARQRQVAQLWIRRVPKGEIAAAVGVERNTITKDIKCIEKQWHDELIGDPVAHKARDLAALDRLERDAAVAFVSEPSAAWWDRRLAALERRAKMLGLDKRPEGLLGSTPENPVYVAPVPGTIDWDAIPDDLADRFLALNAELVALQPASGGMVVNQDGSPVEFEDPQDVPF